MLKQAEAANAKAEAEAKRGHRGPRTGAQRRLVGQEALDAAMNSKWGALFQK